MAHTPHKRGCRTQIAFGHSKELDVRIFVAALVFVGLGVTAVTAHAADNETGPLAGSSVTAPRPMAASYTPQAKRPAILPALYVSLGAMQAWDAFSTNA